MSIYTYTDDFFDFTNLNAIEADVIEEVNKTISTKDAYMIEKLVVNRVYMLLAKESSEGSGFQEKFNIYKKEFEYYRGLSQNATPVTGVASIKIGRA